MVKKFFKGFLNLIGTLVILFLCLFLASSVLPESLVMNTLGYRIYVVISDSMTGVVNYGDAVIVQKTSMYDLKAGDIISFRIDYNNDGVEEVFTHYIASIEAENWQWKIHTKPSISNQWDNWELSDDAVIGKAVYRIPEYGLIVFQLQNPVILGGIVIVLCLLLAVYLIVTWNDHSDKDKKLEKIDK